MYYFWKKLFGFIFALLWLAINLEFIILMHAKPRSINGIRTLQILILCEGSFKRVWQQALYEFSYIQKLVLLHTFNQQLTINHFLMIDFHVECFVLHAEKSSLNNSIEDRIYISGCTQ